MLALPRIPSPVELPSNLHARRELPKYTIMDAKSKSTSVHALDIGGILIALSVIGDTPRFILIYVIFITWLQKKWSAYTVTLSERRSERLAATSYANELRRRQQVADITQAVGEDVVQMLNKRREELVFRLDEESQRKALCAKNEIVHRIIGELALYQERQTKIAEQKLKVREEALLARENSLLVREKKVISRAESLQALRITLKEREQKLSESEKEVRTEKSKFLQETLALSTVATPPQKMFQQSSSSQFKVSASIPADLLLYADDLKSSSFSCIGVTKKGARCRQSMISNFDKSCASARIEKLLHPAPTDSSKIYELEALRELADWMLCPRWHRYELPQGEGIARRWYYELEEARISASKGTSPWSTPPSTGAPSIFSSYSRGNGSSGTETPLSSFGSSGSMTFSSPEYNSTSPFAAGGRTHSGMPVRNNLTPTFRSMAQQP